MNGRTVRGLLAVACSLTVPSGTLAHGVPGRWDRAASSPTGTFSGGTFSPSVAPVIQQRFRGVNDLLGWSVVTFSGSTPVSYLVTRIEPGGAVVPVCLGADAPVTNGATVTCTDRKAPKGSLYSEQPVILNAGSVTWSLAPSVPG